MQDGFPAAATVDRFFDLSLDLLCIVDADGILGHVNPAFTRTLGWTASELASRSYLDFVHPDDHARATGALKDPPWQQRHGTRRVSHARGQRLIQVADVALAVA
ncbi:MAG TPA: PAS domain-containing protein [Gemmatimonadaceae bacterium]